MVYDIVVFEVVFVVVLVGEVDFVIFVVCVY